MIDREHEREFTEWFRKVCVGLEPMRAPRLTAMREAGGIDYTQADAQSMAFQCEFESREDARRWAAEKLAPVAAAFEEMFGPQAMVFASMFETIGL